jgi:diketogulonate reductase-like aldo/keto reductase
LEYRFLGRTSEKIPMIGMGTWRMGRSHTSIERAKQTDSLRRGLELGMTLIDTAESYGDGDSERLVSEVIKGMRDSVFVATKVSPSNLRHDDILAACERSLTRLGTTYVDLYQVHWPNRRVPISESMRAMQELVDRGKVRHVGVSNFSVEETKEAQEALGRSELVSNQVEYSLLNRSIESGLLQFCQSERITVIAYSPLGRGILPTHAIPRRILDEYGLTPAQVALNWVTFQEGVVAIPKSAKREHTEENAASLSTRLSFQDYEVLSKHTK